MDEASIDLLDRRGRFLRLLLAAALGAAATAGLMTAIRSIGTAPEGELLVLISPALLGMGMFVTMSWLAFKVIEKLRERRP